VKSAEDIMEILRAFDLTGSFRDAAELAGCSHHTVARYVAARDAGRLVPGVPSMAAVKECTHPTSRPVVASPGLHGSWSPDWVPRCAWVNRTAGAGGQQRWATTERMLRQFRSGVCGAAGACGCGSSGSDGEGCYRCQKKRDYADGNRVAPVLTWS
jgi:hypothetical protein